MKFVRREVWLVTFLEPGFDRQLARTLTSAMKARLGDWRAAAKHGKPQRIGKCWITR